jgi:hypothetical protein
MYADGHDDDLLRKLNSIATIILEIPVGPDEATSEPTKRLEDIPPWDRPTMRDLYGYNAKMAEDELAFAARRYEYILERRDRISERLRFGSLALNAASIVAIVTALSSAAQPLGKLGVTAGATICVCIAFLIGMILAGTAVWAGFTHAIDVTSDELKHVQGLRHTNALFEHCWTKNIEVAIGEELGERKAVVTADYRYSSAEMALVQWSSLFWLGGVATLAVSLALRLW